MAAKPFYLVWKNFNPVEILTILFGLFYVILTLCHWQQLASPLHHVLIDAGIILLLFCLVQLHQRFAQLDFIRAFYPLALLSFWFGQTAYFNPLFFHYFDPIFAHIDQQLFGFQPSLLFSAVFHQAWFSELMYFGYFSFYFILFFVCFMFYFKKRVDFNRTIFTLVCCSFLYYIVFIFFPVAGPQYYFYPGPESLNLPSGYIFEHLVQFIQRVGEHPTGAFPSSHVGLSLIALYLSRQFSKTLFWVLLPLPLLILFATVYIKAHYAVDVIAAVLTLPLFLTSSLMLYSLFNGKNVNHYARK